MKKKFIFLLFAIPFFFFFFCFPKKADLTVVGRIEMIDGIGKTPVELINHLSSDLKINFLPVKPWSKRQRSKMPKEVLKIVCEHPRTVGNVILFEEMIWRDGYEPYKVLDTIKNKEVIRIAYSMFESSSIPEEWASILNTYFDAVVVPDHFLVEVYANAGVKIPIFKVPLAMDFTSFLNEPLKRSPHFPMVFANFGMGIDRKNQLQLIRAFGEAFGNSPGVLLKINSRYSEPGLNARLKEEIASLQLSNVQLTEEKLDGSDYLRLFKTVDCYVSLSKGEGFSIQPREAMALGIPAIVTNNTAQTTICHSQLVKVVESPIEGPAFYHWGKKSYGVNYDCEVKEVAKALRDVFENYPQYVMRAQKAREWARQYTYEALKPLYLTLIKPKKIVLGSENKVTPDYLMTSSPALYEKYLFIH